MRIKIYLLTIIVLVCLSCKDKNVNTEQTNSSLSDTTIQTIVENALYNQLEELNAETGTVKERRSAIYNILNNYSNVQVDTSVTTLEKVFPISEKAFPFSPADWRKVKNVFNKWRKKEIKNGYYAEDCLSDIDEFFNNSDSDARYALPKISEEFCEYFDTCMVDINFDGKQDVVFKFRPEDCLRGCGTAAHPPMHITILSMGNQYAFNNFYIDKAEKTIKDFTKQLQEGYSYEWFVIKNLSTDKGYIFMSGTSTVLLGDDPTCCHSITFDFYCYMDKSGNGYIDIDLDYYERQSDSTYIFKIKLQIE